MPISCVTVALLETPHGAGPDSARQTFRAQLWKAYLAERREAVRGLPVTHREVAALNNTYERALVTMHKMPRVWQDYLEFLVGQRVVTRARRTFDNALRALPITQHDRLWPQYLVSASLQSCHPELLLSCQCSKCRVQHGILP